MTIDDTSSGATGQDGAKQASKANHVSINVADVWSHLHLPHFQHDHPPVRNANEVAAEKISPLDRLALKITDKVGSMGFFLIIFFWTVIWTGFNIVAKYVPSLHLPQFDPFPAFVDYLLISNVIQILLMPLIMVGQNIQGRHSETRAELDFEINQKAEKEVMAVMHHIEHNTRLLIHLMKHLECKLSEEEMRAIAAETELAHRIGSTQPSAEAVAS